MPKIMYKRVRMRAASLAIVAEANKIIEEYAAKGYDLTLRQLYYQEQHRSHLRNAYHRWDDVVKFLNKKGLLP